LNFALAVCGFAVIATNGYKDHFTIISRRYSVEEQRKTAYQNQKRWFERKTSV